MTEKSFLCETLSDILEAPVVERMSKYVQHGQISTFEHCCAVAYFSLKVSRFFRFKMDNISLVRGAFLHDFYLYDWHVPDKHHRLHGYSHPDTAYRNAKTYFNINNKESGIINSHMWPLTIRKVPRSAEAALVCLVDKYCSLREVLGFQYRAYNFSRGQDGAPKVFREALNG